ncbi:MAG: cyclic pyranopterin monophosphate synthase MoaC, partial [Archaeoglobaceae archaeon]
MEFTHVRGEKAKMVDISEKGEVLRIAVAEGFIRLKKRTIEAILKNEVAKGNVIAVANVAGVMAVKKTPEVIPMCHQIPITSIDFDFKVLENGIRVVCTV